MWCIENVQSGVGGVGEEIYRNRPSDFNAGAVEGKPQLIWCSPVSQSVETQHRDRDVI